jgi:hypothetical protein
VVDEEVHQVEVPFGAETIAWALVCAPAIVRDRAAPSSLHRDGSASFVVAGGREPRE